MCICPVLLIPVFWVLYLGRCYWCVCFLCPVCHPFSFWFLSNRQGKGMRNVSNFAIGTKIDTCFGAFFTGGQMGLNWFGPFWWAVVVIVLFKKKIFYFKSEVATFNESCKGNGFVTSLHWNKACDQRNTWIISTDK